MDLGSFYMSTPLALSFVAFLGYLVGCRRRRLESDLVVRSRRELERAQLVATELERIAGNIRQDLARHQVSLARFKEQVGRLSQQDKDPGWRELWREAEEILRPTLKLATQIATAHDEIRQQTTVLMSFAEVRTDPLTGVRNRRGLEDALTAQFALLNRYQTGFSVVLFDIDHFKQINDQLGHLRGDQMLQQLGRLLDQHARETDVVGRYGGEEFLILLPYTDLQGAAMFADRVRRAVAQNLGMTISGGVACATDGDSRDSLFARADNALYAAKSAGRNCVFRHTGADAEPITEEAAVGCGEGT